MKQLIKYLLISIMLSPFFIGCCKAQMDNTNEQPNKSGYKFPDFSWEIEDDNIIDYRILCRAELIKWQKPFAILFIEDVNCKQCSRMRSYITAALYKDDRIEENFKKFSFIVVTKGKQDGVEKLFNYPVKFFVQLDEKTFEEFDNSGHSELYICDKNAIISSYFGPYGENSYPYYNYLDYHSAPWDINLCEDIRDAFMKVIYEN